MDMKVVHIFKLNFIHFVDMKSRRVSKLNFFSFRGHDILFFSGIYFLLHEHDIFLLCKRETCTNFLVKDFLFLRREIPQSFLVKLFHFVDITFVKFR